MDELLTPREREVLELLRLDLTNEQIAQQLGISLNGAKYHVSEILSKLGVSSRQQAARWPERRAWWGTALVPLALLWRNTRALWPVKVSSLAAAASIGLLAAAVGGLALIGFLLVRTSGSPDERQDRALALFESDPQGFLAESLASMAGLDSYHVVLTSPGLPGDARGELRIETEFAVPDKYRVRSLGVDGESEKICESGTLPDALGGGQICYEIFTSITSRSMHEELFVGGKAYRRECAEDGEGCTSWIERRPPSTIFDWPVGTEGTAIINAPVLFDLPQWPLIGAELAQDLHVVAGEEVEGATLIHLRGSVNSLRAQIESQRRFYSPATLASYSTVCGESAGGQSSCRDVSFEEFVQLQEPQLSFYDANPHTIDVWLSPDDLLVRRIALRPGLEPFGEERPLITEYSRFDQVEIEAPD